jgi:hypothetical protein
MGRERWSAERACGAGDRGSHGIGMFAGDDRYHKHDLEGKVSMALDYPVPWLRGDE